MQELLFVSGNRGKFQELTDYLGRHNIPVKLVFVEADLEELQERDEKKVVLHKARDAWNKFKKPLIIDDGGFYYHAYPEFPGTLSKQAIQTLGMKGLFKLAEDGPGATIYSWIVYVEGEETMQLFRGETVGTVDQARAFEGRPGLRFYGIFKPDGSEKVLADMNSNPEEGDFYFHRLRAFKKFCDWFCNEKSK